MVPLSVSDASIVSNFQADLRKIRVGNRDFVQSVKTWVQGERKHGKTGGAADGIHIERNTGFRHTLDIIQQEYCKSIPSYLKKSQ